MARKCVVEWWNCAAFLHLGGGIPFVGVSDHDSPAVSWGASRDPRAWQVKSFCQASALCSRTIAGLSEQFRAERTWIGGESTWISSQPDQASPVKSHRASLSRQTIGIGWGISGEGGSAPKGIYRKGLRKMLEDALTNLIKNHCIGAPSTEINMSRPLQ